MATNYGKVGSVVQSVAKPKGYAGGSQATGINYSKGISPFNVATASDSAFNQYLAAIEASSAANRALANSYNREVYAPNWDTNAINAQARKEAAKGVNKYYQKELNLFLKGQKLAKTKSQQQAKTDIQNYEDILKETLEGNKITGERTTQDTAQNVANINTQADEFQTDSGQEFDTERFAQAQVAAQSGLTGGLGAQKGEALQIANNTAEKRQTTQFNQAKQQQELAKARTFEDLARSGAQAATAKEKGVKQTKFDLDYFLKQHTIETTKGKRALEKERQADILSKGSKITQTKLNNMIRAISDPAKRNAALKAYGGLYG